MAMLPALSLILLSFFYTLLLSLQTLLLTDCSSDLAFWWMKIGNLLLYVSLRYSLLVVFCNRLAISFKGSALAYKSSFIAALRVISTLHIIIVYILLVWNSTMVEVNTGWYFIKYFSTNAQASDIVCLFDYTAIVIFYAGLMDMLLNIVFLFAFVNKLYQLHRAIARVNGTSITASHRISQTLSQASRSQRSRILSKSHTVTHPMQAYPQSQLHKYIQDRRRDFNNNINTNTTRNNIYNSGNTSTSTSTKHFTYANNYTKRSTAAIPSLPSLPAHQSYPPPPQHHDTPPQLTLAETASRGNTNANNSGKNSNNNSNSNTQRKHTPSSQMSTLRSNHCSNSNSILPGLSQNIISRSPRDLSTEPSPQSLTTVLQGQNSNAATTPIPISKRPSTTAIQLTPQWSQQRGERTPDRDRITPLPNYVSRQSSISRSRMSQAHAYAYQSAIAGGTVGRGGALRVSKSTMRMVRSQGRHNQELWVIFRKVTILTVICILSTLTFPIMGYAVYRPLGSLNGLDIMINSSCVYLMHNFAHWVLKPCFGEFCDLCFGITCINCCMCDPNQSKMRFIAQQTKAKLQAQRHSLTKRISSSSLGLGLTFGLESNDENHGDNDNDHGGNDNGNINIKNNYSNINYIKDVKSKTGTTTDLIPPIDLDQDTLSKQIKTIEQSKTERSIMSKGSRAGGTVTPATPAATALAVAMLASQLRESEDEQETTDHDQSEVEIEAAKLKVDSTTSTMTGRTTTNTMATTTNTMTGTTTRSSTGRTLTSTNSRGYIGPNGQKYNGLSIRAVSRASSNNKQSSSLSLTNTTSHINTRLTSAGSNTQTDTQSPVIILLNRSQSNNEMDETTGTDDNEYRIERKDSNWDSNENESTTENRQERIRIAKQRRKKQQQQQRRNVHKHERERDHDHKRTDTLEDLEIAANSKRGIIHRRRGRGKGKGKTRGRGRSRTETGPASVPGNMRAQNIVITKKDRTQVQANGQRKSDTLYNRNSKRNHRKRVRKNHSHTIEVELNNHLASTMNRGNNLTIESKDDDNDDDDDDDGDDIENVKKKRNACDANDSRNGKRHNRHKRHRGRRDENKSVPVTYATITRPNRSRRQSEIFGVENVEFTRLKKKSRREKEAQRERERERERDNHNYNDNHKRKRGKEINSTSTQTTVVKFRAIDDYKVNALNEIEENTEELKRQIYADDFSTDQTRTNTHNKFSHINMNVNMNDTDQDTYIDEMDDDIHNIHYLETGDDYIHTGPNSPNSGISGNSGNSPNSHHYTQRGMESISRGSLRVNRHINGNGNSSDETGQSDSLAATGGSDRVSDGSEHETDSDSDNDNDNDIDGDSDSGSDSENEHSESSSDSNIGLDDDIVSIEQDFAPDFTIENVNHTDFNNNNNNRTNNDNNNDDNNNNGNEDRHPSESL